MIDLMKYIDYMYDPIHTMDGKEEYTVFLKEGLWRILGKDDELVTMSNDPEHILMYADKLNLNMQQLDSYLRYHVSTMAVVHMMELKKCRLLIGQELIDEAYQGWGDFGKSMEKFVKKTNLKLVKKDEPSVVQLEIVEDEEK